MKDGPTNHNCIKDVFKNRRGEEFATAEIKRMVLAKYVGFKPRSVLPNDHAEGNKSPCWCAGTESRLFERVGHGMYRVR